MLNKPPRLNLLIWRRNSAKPSLYASISLDGASNTVLPAPSIATVLPLASFTKARSSLNFVYTSLNCGAITVLPDASLKPHFPFTETAV